MNKSSIGKAAHIGGSLALILAAASPAGADPAMVQAVRARDFGSLGHVYDGSSGGGSMTPVDLSGGSLHINSAGTSGTSSGSSSGQSVPSQSQISVPPVGMAYQNAISGGGSGLGTALAKVATGAGMGLIGAGIGGLLLGPVGAVVGAGIGLYGADRAVKGSPGAAAVSKIGMASLGAGIGASIGSAALVGAGTGAFLGPLGMLMGAAVGGVLAYAVAKHATGGI